jgi:phosphatidylinositol kinase/protein kinase (PI-3  family)
MRYAPFLIPPRTIQPPLSSSRKNYYQGIVRVIQIADCRYPPVLWEWFVEEFSGPTAWFESRMKFSRTLAVMSFVGYVLGLGDRQSENILLDATSGAAVHVDFNCLFEKVFGHDVHNLSVRVKVSRNLNACHSG